MKSPASSLGLGTEFDDFLFAPIEERNGLPLSVVSLLGRMDLDPWQEAASLAALPAEAAAQRLTSLLGLLPGPPLQRPDSGTLAARLVALLPRRPDSNTRRLQASVSGAATTHSRAISNGILLTIYLAVMLATQLVIARLGATHADAAHTPASVTDPSQTAPPAAQRNRSWMTGGSQLPSKASNATKTVQRDHPLRETSESSILKREPSWRQLTHSERSARSRMAAPG